MCQIYVRLKNCIDLPYNIVDNERYINPDGVGISYVDNQGVLQVIKTFNYDIAEQTIRTLELENRQFIVHFRFTTAGSHEIDNLHPFYINENLVMFHNGTISQFSNSNKKSDTRLFSEFLTDLGIKTIEDVKLLENDIINIIGTNYDKLVFMDNEENIFIINDWLGEYSEDYKLWSSSTNPFYKAKKKSKKKSYFDNYIYDYDISHSITDNYGNYTQYELDMLQYLLDFEPEAIKETISRLVISEGVLT